MTETPDQVPAMQQWKWRGQPGHFCVPGRCNWHLHTDVGHFCVSSVGEYCDPARAEDDYESVVLQLDGDGERVSWTPLEERHSETRCQAERTHVALCRKYSQGLAEEEAYEGGCQGALPPGRPVLRPGADVRDPSSER